MCTGSGTKVPFAKDRFVTCPVCGRHPRPSPRAKGGHEVVQPHKSPAELKQ